MTSDHPIGLISPLIKPSIPLWIPRGLFPENMQFLKWNAVSKMEHQLIDS